MLKLCITAIAAACAIILAGIMALMAPSACVNSAEAAWQAHLPEGIVSREEYFEDGFQDYTDYCKYTYPPDSRGLFESSPLYSPVTAPDIDALPGYFEDFAKWADTLPHLKGAYDFDPACVDGEDLFSLEFDEYPTPPYTNYTLWYFDVQTDTLYYFHNNV